MAYSIIVLCGGLGSRLASIKKVKAKILAHIGSKLFVDYFLKWLNVNDNFVEDLIFAMGYKSTFVMEYINKSQINIKASIEERQKGTLPAIIQAKNLSSSEDILVLNGDTVFDVCFQEMYLKYKEFDQTPLLSLKKINSKNNRFKSGYQLKNNKFLKFVNENPDYVSCGAFFCKRKSLEKKLLNVEEWNNDKKYDLDLYYLNKMNPRPFLCAQNYMLDIGSVKTFNEAQEFMPIYIPLNN